MEPARRYNNPAIALNCGSMLRDCVRDENLAGCAASARPARPARRLASCPSRSQLLCAKRCRRALPCVPCLRLGRMTGSLACSHSGMMGISGVHGSLPRHRRLCAHVHGPAWAAVRAGRARRLVLEGPLFGQFFEKVEVTNFEVASDAFATFKDLLTRHKGLVARYLAAYYDQARARGRAAARSCMLGQHGSCLAGIPSAVQRR